MRSRRAISSIYGFIVIFLLSMASLQTWSYAVGSMTTLQAASVKEQQIQGLQSTERLVLEESGSNLTIINDGQIPSTLEFLRLVGSDGSKTIPLGDELAIGSSQMETVDPEDTIQVVTSLGDVFTYSPPPSVPQGSVWSGTTLTDGLDNAQLFQGPYDGSPLFVSDGSNVYAFSASGSPEWSFDAGSGYVTDVLQLSDGDVFVSVSSSSTSNIANLYQLTPEGMVVHDYPVRASEADSSSVVEGGDPDYVFYDGFFYSSAGIFGSLVSESPPLAGTDSSGFYFYYVTPSTDSNGTCQYPGNSFVLESYSPSVKYGYVVMNWDDYVSLGACNRFPQQLIGSAVGDGVVASLLASPPYAVSSEEVYPGQNPYLVVISTAGQTLYEGQAPDEGYTSVATNGTDVYLALPQPGVVQVYSLSKETYRDYDIGMQASQMVFAGGDLFAISNDEVKVFGASMNLKNTIALAPLALASASDSFVQDAPLQTPSFVVLNSTAFAALVSNSTGFASLLIGDY